MLARQQFSQKIPWRRVQLYWSDERCVPPDDLASNYGMARDALLKHAPIAVANVHRVHGEEAPERAALAYEKELRALAALERPHSELPVFDLVLLGLGGDGHTASLFPRSDALAVEERFAVATEAPDGSPRVTVTYPVINAARRVWFLVSGAQKAGMVAEVLEGLQVPNAVPAQGVRPVHGKLTWLLDEAAAAELSPALRG
jgi:6-phosphogluconolactonase